MLNKAFTHLDVEALLKMGVFIRDLHQNITKLHSEQLSSLTTDTVYCGKTMDKNVFKDKIKQGGLISFNNFLSTRSKEQKVIEFITCELNSATANENTIGILFEIKIDRSIPSTSAKFAYIHEVSQFPEDEILFSTHTVFRVHHIQQIKQLEMEILQVKLSNTTENDDQKLTALSATFREQITGTGWQRMSMLLWKLGANDKAEQLLTMLLKQASNVID